MQRAAWRPPAGACSAKATHENPVPHRLLTRSSMFMISIWFHWWECKDSNLGPADLRDPAVLSAPGSRDPGAESRDVGTAPVVPARPSGNGLRKWVTKGALPPRKR